jgi:hypothetical protein
MEALASEFESSACQNDLHWDRYKMKA